MKKVLPVVIFSIVLCLSISVEKCFSQNNEKSMSEEERKTIVKVANKKAIELGYKIDDLTVTISTVEPTSEQGEMWEVYFAPKTFQLGGDLSIWINKGDLSVDKVIRGQ